MTYQGSPDETDDQHLDLLPPRPRRGTAGRPRRGTAGCPRRGRRSAWFWPAVGLAVAGAAVVALALVQDGQSRASPEPGALVTKFMAGEIQRMPAACTAIPAAVLDQYMPGSSKPAASQPLEGNAASQCSWTLDKPQAYRFMELALEAYAPSGLATGNGSATQAAQDAFVGAKVAKQFPPKRSQNPAAVVTSVSGLGDEAFAADQVFRRGAVLDMVTLVARYRNVLVTVVIEARTGGGFGADHVSMLTAGAQAVARDALTRLG